MKKVLTVKDIEEILGVCNKTAYRLVQRAIITITFSNRTDEEMEQVYKDIAQACYNLCLHEYKKKKLK